MGRHCWFMHHKYNMVSVQARLDDPRDPLPFYFMDDYTGFSIELTRKLLRVF